MSKSSQQADLETFQPEMDETEITRTVRLKLQTSERKLQRVRRAIEEWQRVAEYTANLLPSFPSYRWGSRDTQLRRRVRAEFDDLSIYAHDRDAAVAKVREAFSSWHERGQDGDAPTGEFGDGDYLRMSTSSSSKQRREIVRNEQGFGFRISLLKPESDPLWFHIQAGEYQHEYLDRLVDGDSRLGVVELRLDGGTLYAHVSISETVDVYEVDDVTRSVGVDLGENTLWAAAVVDSDGVATVEMESGREFRHYREQLEQKRKRLSQQDDLKGVRATRGDRERYTEQVCHTASRRIVDLAADHAPAVIVLEDLSDYRETAEEAIHDWPFAQLQEQICYKATAAGVPVEFVDPARTSTTCRKCGQYTPEYRDGDEWHCRRCGYEVHADVNAAINLAQID